MTSIMRRLPYEKRMIMLGVYDIIDTLGGDAVKNSDNVVTSSIEVFGALNEYCFRVDAMETGCMLSISFARPAAVSMSEVGERRAAGAELHNRLP